MTDQVHVRGRNLDDLTAVVRGVDGIFDLTYSAQDGWRCSCGSATGECAHAGKVLLHLEDLAS